jgi:S-adenosylmethionine hydrolase
LKHRVKFSTPGLLPSMPLLTLTTDWGHKDAYVASFKGEILKHQAETVFVDISHSFDNYDMMSAAFVIGSSFRHFPEGTLHFIGIDCGGGPHSNSETDYLIVHFQGHWFIGADSGIFSMIFQEKESSCWKLPIDKNASLKHVLPLVTSSIGKLLRGADPNELGIPHSKLISSHFSRPTADPSGIRCTVIYIDSFGNAVFNLNRDLFERERKGRPFTILVRRATYQITKICTHYNQVEEGDILAIFNQNDLLEIALYKDDAAQLVGFKLFDSILIEFHDNQDS